MNPKISVIIPIFGTEAFLDKCIKSVINQTFKDIEIICVDDCSPDNSYKIVEKYLKQDNRISLIRHEKNLGLGGARNTAIRVAKAEYIASVDSDDCMLPNMLEELWYATDNGWFDVVCCGFDRVDGTGNILSYEAYPEKQVINDDNEINIFATLNPAFWNKLWRKSLFVDNDIYFPIKDYFEDMSTTPRILSRARYIKVIKKRLYQYLIRPESITGSYSAKHIIDYFKGFEIILRFLEENNLSQRYQQEFCDYIKSNTLFHSKFILASDKHVEEKKQYLQHLLLLRMSFVENFQLIKTKELADLLSLLGQDDVLGNFHIKYQYIVKNAKREKSELDDQLIKLTDKLNAVKKEEYDLRQQSIEWDKKASIYWQQLNEKETNYQQQLNEKESSYREKMKKAIEEMGFYQRKVIKLEQELGEKLSFGQMIGIFAFGFFARPTLSRSQLQKLKKKPRLFFNDSRNKFARKFATIMGII